MLIANSWREMKGKSADDKEPLNKYRGRLPRFDPYNQGWKGHGLVYKYTEFLRASSHIYFTVLPVQQWLELRALGEQVSGPIFGKIL